MSSYNQDKSHMPQKKQNQIHKAFLGLKDYSKEFRVILSKIQKNVMFPNVLQQKNYATFSYDEIQLYTEIPQSAKLPSNKYGYEIQSRGYSKELMQSGGMMNNNSEEYSVKAKSKKSHGHIHLSQSSNEIPYLKSKKSSYSQMEKSEGNKSIGGSKTLLRDPPMKTMKEYDVHSVNKEKYQYQALHESLGGIKTESFFKLQSKKSFNYSNAYEYESEKLSGEQKHSYQKLNRKAKRIQINNYTDLVRQEKNEEDFGPYNLSPTNFVNLINKVEELQGVVVMYQEAIGLMKKKILKQEETIKGQQMMEIFVDELKNEISDQKVKNAELREKLQIQDMKIKEFEKVMLESIEKVSRHYQKELSKIAVLQKQNHFLKFMLRLEIEQNPETNKNDRNQPMKTQIVKQNSEQEEQSMKSSQKSEIKLSKNIAQFKDKFTKLMSEKSKKTSS